MVDSIESGGIWFNTDRESLPVVPFGGYEESGYGRENETEALHENTKIKTLWIDLSEDAGDSFVLRV